MSYDGSANGSSYKYWEIPLTVEINNECKPDRFYIDDYGDNTRTLGSEKNQTLMQEATPLTWGATDFVVEGVDNTNGLCNDPIVAMQLVTYNNEVAANNVYNEI